MMIRSTQKKILLYNTITSHHFLQYQTQGLTNLEQDTDTTHTNILRRMGKRVLLSDSQTKISYTNTHDNHKATETCAIIDAYDTLVHKQLLTRRTNITNTEVHGSIRAQHVHCTLNISTRTIDSTNDTNIQKSDISKLSPHSNNRLRRNKTSTNTRTALTTPIPLLYSHLAMMFLCNREIRHMH